MNNAGARELPVGSQPVKGRTSHFVVATTLFFTVSLSSQNVNMEHPQEIHVQHRLSAEEIRDRLSGPQLQNDVKELSELSATIPADMDGIKKGELGKDVIEKLKRLEKLSKRVRAELTRASTEQ
jgi:hypothetical protein